jgi:hypothetical protein
LPLKKLRFFKLSILLNKMGSLDLQDLVVSSARKYVPTHHLYRLGLLHLLA